MPLMAKFEIDEFEERLTDNYVQQIEINTKKDTACLCISLIWTLYFNFFPRMWSLQASCDVS